MDEGGGGRGWERKEMKGGGRGMTRREDREEGKDEEKEETDDMILQRHDFNIYTF